MERDELESHAQKMGAAAFAAGIKPSPLLDKDLMALLAGRSVGDPRTTIQLAWWTNGWHRANLLQLGAGH